MASHASSTSNIRSSVFSVASRALLSRLMVARNSEYSSRLYGNADLATPSNKRVQTASRGLVLSVPYSVRYLRMDRTATYVISAVCEDLCRPERPEVLFSFVRIG